jgi:hypothetical protein
VEERSDEGRAGFLVEAAAVDDDCGGEGSGAVGDVEVEEEGLAAGAGELDGLPVERGEGGGDEQEDGEAAHRRHCIAARV